MGFFNKLNQMAKQAQEAAESALNNVDTEKLKNPMKQAKGFADSAIKKAKNEYEKQKLEHEKKKAEQEKHNQLMLNKSAELASLLTSKIENAFNGTPLWSEDSVSELISFTKNFGDKILLPANEFSKSSIICYPNVPGEMVDKFKQEFNCFTENETPLIYIPHNGTLGFLLTKKNFYFTIPNVEDNSFFSDIMISIEKLSDLCFQESDSGFDLFCNGVEVGNFSKLKFDNDVVSFTEYIRCLKNSDFDITDEEVDNLIHKKIGDDLYYEIKQYMVSEDELVTFFCVMGVADAIQNEFRSSTSKNLIKSTKTNYLICTSKQIILVEKGIFNNTENIQQFFFDEITSLHKNKNNLDVGFHNAKIDLILSAAKTLYSFWQHSSLEIVCDRTKNRIPTIKNIEAERIISIYHQFKTNLKKQNSSPILLPMSNSSPDTLSQLEKLAKLKDNGIITEEEFQNKKAKLLNDI